ncbi:MAG: glycosyltransferase family 1 protein [Nitrospiraceae bacterium]|nr:MAG: glycosyltransferase family 1 protein [Nitrospiraceae bacterium]
MKKYNIIIWETYSTMGGGQKVSLDILDALKDKYRCIFFVPEEGDLTGNLRARGIEYKILPIGSYSDGRKGLKDILTIGLFFPGVLMTAYRHVKKNRISLIYSNSSRSFIWSSIIGRLLSIPVIWHVHNFVADNKTLFILNRLGKIGSVRKVIFVSRAVKEQFPLLKDKAEIIYNGLNIGRFMKGGSGADNKNKLSVPPSVKIISTISWISRPKKTEIFLKAVPYVLNRYGGAHFLVVGGVKKGHENYHASLLKLVRKLGITDHVTFTGQRNDISDLLKSIHINCVTSLETYSLTIPESYCFGVPVIGPDTGGPVELIKDRETGLIYKFGNEKDLAEKICLLLGNKELHAVMSRNCKAAAREFDVAKFDDSIRAAVWRIID